MSSLWQVIISYMSIAYRSQCASSHSFEAFTECMFSVNATERYHLLGPVIRGAATLCFLAVSLTRYTFA